RMRPRRTLAPLAPLARCFADEVVAATDPPVARQVAQALFPYDASGLLFGAPETPFRDPARGGFVVNIVDGQPVAVLRQILIENRDGLLRLARSACPSRPCIQFREYPLDSRVFHLFLP